MSMPRTSRSAGIRARLLAAEDRVFSLAAEAEYRLKLAPRNTRIVATAFDRRVLRTIAVALPLLLGTFVIGSRRVRMQVLFCLIVLMCVAFAAYMLADALPGLRRKRKP